jgi:phosphoglycerate kinase
MTPILNADIKPGTRVFFRGDLDVPIENGQILEPFRLDSLLETLNYILSKNAKPIIAGHIGKPDGKVVEDLSTMQLLPYFNEKLGEGNFELLENLRFNPGEEKNDPVFAKELASKADVYVNDSFATCHRKHASIVGITEFLPSYAGCELQKEVETLGKLLKNPQRPLVAIIGGAKLESKKPVISVFLEIADFVLTGGKLGLDWKEAVPAKLILPLDYAGDNKDIGPETIKKFKDIISRAKTILWAGPMGLYEEEEFFTGTKEIAQAIAKASTEDGAFSVIGGGDTIAAVNKAGVANKFNFISTGGGAMLQYLAEGTLPGLDALNESGRSSVA